VKHLSVTKSAVLAIVIAVAIVVAALRKDAVDAIRARDSAGTQGTPSASTEPLSAGASGDDDSDNDGEAAQLLSTALPRESTYAQPAQLENLLLQLVAAAGARSRRALG